MKAQAGAVAVEIKKKGGRGTEKIYGRSNQ